MLCKMHWPSAINWLNLLVCAQYREKKTGYEHTWRTHPPTCTHTNTNLHWKLYADPLLTQQSSDTHMCRLLGAHKRCTNKPDLRTDRGAMRRLGSWAGVEGGRGEGRGGEGGLTIKQSHLIFLNSFNMLLIFIWNPEHQSNQTWFWVGRQLSKSVHLNDVSLTGCAHSFSILLTS